MFANFEMPGVKLVPEYDTRVEVMRQAGIDRSVFLQKVYFPILKYLGISRHELLAVTQPRVVYARQVAAPPGT
ncbi:MAG TPA: hypothetical protein VGL13_16290 [Polyangiaceae bacterium]